MVACVRRCDGDAAFTSRADPIHVSCFADLRRAARNHRRVRLWLAVVGVGAGGRRADGRCSRGSDASDQRDGRHDDNLAATGAAFRSTGVRAYGRQDARTPSPYLTPHEACAYLRYASLGALYQAVRTHGIPVCRRGRSLLFPRRQLDRWLAGERRSDLRLEARRRSENVTPVLPKRSQKQTP